MKKNDKSNRGSWKKEMKMLKTDSRVILFTLHQSCCNVLAVPTDDTSC